MQENNIKLSIIKYAVPSILSMWIFTLYTMVDGIFISKYVNSTAFSSIALIMPLINLIFALSITIGVGGSTLGAIYFGKKENNIGNYYISLSYYILIFLGLSITFFVLIFIDNIIHFLIYDNELAFYCKEYLKHLIPFSTFFILGYATEAYIKLDGSPRYPGYCVIVGGIVNLTLDYIFMAKMNMGIKGASIATGISQLITCSFLMGYIFFKTKKIKLSFIKPDIFKILEIIAVGTPEFITEISTGIATLAFNFALEKKLGKEGILIYGSIVYIASFVTMTMIGYNQGVQPLISYNYGKQNISILKSIRTFSIKTMITLGILVFLGITIFSKGILDIFYNEIISTTPLRLYSLSFILAGITIFISGYLTATKKTSPSIMIIIIKTTFLVVFLLLINSREYIWLSPFLAELFTLGFSLFLLFKK